VAATLTWNSVSIRGDFLDEKEALEREQDLNQNAEADGQGVQPRLGGGGEINIFDEVKLRKEKYSHWLKSMMVLDASLGERKSARRRLNDPGWRAAVLHGKFSGGGRGRRRPGGVEKRNRLRWGEISKGGKGRGFARGRSWRSQTTKPRVFLSPPSGILGRGWKKGEIT